MLSIRAIKARAKKHGAGIPRVSSPATWGAAIVRLAAGPIFLGFSVPMFLTGMGIMESGGKNASDETILGFAALFAGAGVLVFFLGLGMIPAVLRNRRVRHPWHRVKQWKDGWIEELERPDMLKLIFGAVVVGGFLTPFWMLLMEGVLPPFFFGIIILITGVFAVSLLYALLRAIKYSPSRLKVEQRFYRPGEPAAVQLHCKAGLSICEKLTFELQYVQQKEVRRGSGKNSTTKTISDILHTRRLEFAAEDFPMRIVPLPPPVELKIPENDEWVTRLEQATRYFWILTVRAKTPGVDYCSQFLIPVFHGDES